MKVLLSVAFLLLISLQLFEAKSLTEILSRPETRDNLRRFEKALTKAASARATLGPIRDISVECGLCGIAVNEIEAFVLENRTLTFIETQLENDICSVIFGGYEYFCDDLIQDLPEIIQRIEDAQSVGVICVELEYCTKPFSNRPDPSGVPSYVIDLDLPPSQRWTEICSNSTFQQVAQYLVTTVATFLGQTGNSDIEELGRSLNEYYFPTEYAQEIQGCASAFGIDYGWVTLLNMGYEVSDACTSIVAETTDGTIYHARNLDFWDGMGFTDSLKDLAFHADYQKGGETVFQAMTFAGYSGVLSGMKPNAFSATIDTRFYPQGLGDMFYEIIAAIEERNASLVSFLTRNVFQNSNDFHSALDNLSNDELIADVYYILAGVSSGEGAVISRNRFNATNVWNLDVSEGRWYLVQTNYDHWKQPPWFDDRVHPAENAMNEMGQENLTLEGMFQVLSVKPVLNLQTTYSILACPAESSFEGWTRYCPYPCVE